MAGNRYAAPKAPTDLTGRRGVELQREQQEKRDREAAELAAKDPGRKDVALDQHGIHPETGRHGGGDDPEATEHVRVSFPIEEMTFGKEVVDAGEFDENGLCTRLPVLGPLKMYTFQEGREYRMTPEMAGHLRQQGYLFVRLRVAIRADKREGTAGDVERQALAGSDDRTCRICQADISGMRADAQTCSDLHRKQWLRLRAKMIDDTSSGTGPDNSVSRGNTDSSEHAGPPGLQGASDIGRAGAASRRLNRARNGRPRVIPGGQFGVYDIRPSWVTPVASRAGDDLDWAKLAEASGDYR